MSAKESSNDSSCGAALTGELLALRLRDVDLNVGVAVRVEVVEGGLLPHATAISPAAVIRATKSVLRVAGIWQGSQRRGSHGDLLECPWEST